MGYLCEARNEAGSQKLVPKNVDCFYSAAPFTNSRRTYETLKHDKAITFVG